MAKGRAFVIVLTTSLPGSDDYQQTVATIAALADVVHVDQIKDPNREAANARRRCGDIIVWAINCPSFNSEVMLAIKGIDDVTLAMFCQVKSDGEWVLP